MTLDELLAEMRMNERVSVVQLEPRDVRRWREVLDDVRAERDLLRKRVEDAIARCREVIAIDSSPFGTNEARTMLHILGVPWDQVVGPGAGTPRGPELDEEVRCSWCGATSRAAEVKRLAWQSENKEPVASCVDKMACVRRMSAQVKP